MQIYDLKHPFEKAFGGTGELVMSKTKGWECPNCHRVYAPSVEQCKECTPRENTEKPDVRYYDNDYSSPYYKMNF